MLRSSVSSGAPSLKISSLTVLVTKKKLELKPIIVYRCFIGVHGVSAKREDKACIHVFVLFPSIMLKHLSLQSSAIKQP